MRATDLSFSQRGRPILKHLNFSVHAGKIVAVMGPSGIGKTTLLRIFSGQWYADSGEVELLGQQVGRLSRQQLFALRKRVGVLFQEGGLFSDLNVFDNVAFPLRQHTDWSESMIRDLVLLTLEMVGLRGARDLHVEQLSGGMARRVALARAVILGPEVMFYDEPFTGQDPISRGVLTELILKLNEAFNMTSIVVSHDVPETVRIADEIFLLAGGELIARGHPRVLLVEQDARVQQFLQGLADGPVSFHYPALPIMEELGLCGQE